MRCQWNRKFLNLRCQRAVSRPSATSSSRNVRFASTSIITVSTGERPARSVAGPMSFSSRPYSRAISALHRRTLAASRVRGEVMRAMRGRRIGYQPKKSMTIAISRSAASSSANRDVAAQAIPAARGPHSSKTGSNAAIASTGAQKVARGC